MAIGNLAIKCFWRTRMNRIFSYLLVLAFIPSISFADEILENLNFKQLADREIENIKAGKFEYFHLIWGKPSAKFQSMVADAHKKLAQNGNSKPLLSTLDDARKAGAPGNSFAGFGVSCVESIVMDNTGGWIGSRSCGTIYADRAWVQANLYSGGGYHLLSSFGPLIDFGYHDSGATFLISYTPSGYASELSYFYNMTQ